MHDAGVPMALDVGWVDSHDLIVVASMQSVHNLLAKPSTNAVYLEGPKSKCPNTLVGMAFGTFYLNTWVLVRQSRYGSCGLLQGHQTTECMQAVIDSFHWMSVRLRQVNSAETTLARAQLSDRSPTHLD